jgi:tetratricopeptide (TPR) repeat protein
VSTGQAPAPGASGPGIYVPKSGYAASSGLVSGSHTTTDYLTKQSIQPAVIGYGKTLEGQEYQRTASPLLGINASLVTAQKTGVEPIAPPGPVPVAEPANPFAPGPVTTPGADKDKDKDKGNGTSVKGPGVNPDMISSSAAGPTTKVRPIDTQVDTRMQTPTVITEDLQRELARARSEGADKTDKGAAEGDKKGEEEKALQPWEAQIDRIRRALNQQPEKKTPNKPGSDQGTTPDDGSTPNKADDKGGPGAKPDNGGAPGSRSDRAKRAADDSLSKLDPATLKAMQRSHPLVPSLAGTARIDNAAYTDHMAVGQRLLKDGKYFDAEARFDRALEAAPHDSMASVGQVHSQLGAQLYMSAALNLKNLFKRSPEMVGAKYGQGLLPSEESTKKMVAQLREALPDDRNGLGRDAALLMAYLGYQRSDAKLLADGMSALAAKTDPNDPSQTTLLGLLHKVWVEGTDAGTSKAAPGAAPPPKAPDPSK